MDPIIRANRNKCCVPGCVDRLSKRHRFPTNDTTLLQRWIEAVAVPKLKVLAPEQIYRQFYVCDSHFSAEYKVPDTRRGLRKDAFPTLNLLDRNVVEVMEDPVQEIVHSDAAHNLQNIEQRPVLPEHHVEPSTSTVGHIEEPQPSTSRADHIEEPQPSTSRAIHSFSPVFPVRKRNGILQAVGVTRQHDLTPRCKKFYKHVVQWGLKTAKLNSRIRNLRSRLANAERVATSPGFENLLNGVNEATYTFIMQQIRTQQQKPKGRRYTLDEKILCLTMLKGSTKGYRLLSKIFSLPSIRTLTNLLNKLPFRPGINKQMFNCLKHQINKLQNENDKLCVLVFDEMSITPLLSYNRRLDCVEGVEDYGDRRTTRLANHANVFMLKGVFRQWKQPLSFTFSNGPTKSAQLKIMLVETIRACQDIGLEIVATICDQGSANKAAINSLLRDTQEVFTRAGEENPNFGFMVDGAEIIPLYDVPHLFKGIRNNLMSKDLHYTHDGISKVAKWDHIVQFYALDTMDDTRLCTKLTDAHVNRRKINKMKVSLMAQVFSNKVGSLMKRIAKWDIRSEHKLPPEAEDTADLVLFIDVLFDSVNGNNKVPSRSKPMKGAVTMESGHHDFWRASIQVLKTMRFKDAHHKLVKVPSVTNLIKTLEGFIYMSAKLLERILYVLPRAFNQDCIENFFASMRSHGRRYTHPDVSHFMTSFKALLVNNFMSRHSAGANCEADFSEGALDNLRELLTGEPIAGVQAFDETIENVPHEVIRSKTTRVAKSTIAYFAGFVGRKIIKSTHQCVECRRLLEYSHGDVPLEVIEASEYAASKLQRPGSFLYYICTATLCRLFFIIPRHCGLGNFSAKIKEALQHHINTRPLCCSDHPHIGDLLLSFIIRCIIFFWCKQVNRILMGKDERFVKRVNTHLNSIDPVKLQAQKMYDSRRKYRK